MINLSNWLMGLMSFFTPKFDSVVSAVAGPVIGGLMGGGGDSGTSGYSQPAYQFTPYNITTPYGSSTFDTGAKTASYTLSPQLQAFVDAYMGGAKAALPTTTQTDFANAVSNYGLGLFNKAQAMDTGAMASDYLNKELAALAPARAQEQSQLADTLFKTGRTGAAAGMTNVGGQTGYVNPEQFSLLSAREAQNAQLALGAEDRARAIQNQDLANALNYYGQGQTLFSAPYNTSANILGLGTNIQNLGQNALTLGANIGTASGNQLYQGTQAGIAQQDAINKANAQNAAYWGGLGTNIGTSLGNIYKNAGGWSGITGGWGSGTAAIPTNTPSFEDYYNMPRIV